MGEVECHVENRSRCGKYELDFRLPHQQLTDLH